MSHESESNMSHKAQNRLGLEKSPYLLQHANNPVDWYPWGAEAFEKAREENKPIFLSVGYSTCHWCHVMEKESFEAIEVAKLMNEIFVSIKVDREERPDIDSIYMNVCQMMTGSGGWPLTIIMTPEKKPFFAATYIPKESRFGRMGMLELIPQIAEAWQSRREEIASSGEKITNLLIQSANTPAGEELGEASIKRAYDQLSKIFDTKYGGFGNAPKFPTPHQLIFFLHYWKSKGNPDALWMAEKTLQSLRRGGIYDHVGFGFHRYSTDSRWLVPHFEKMIYDQAMISMAYVEAYQATGKGEYGKTAHEIFTYVLRDMTAEDGGFYSAEDADSEGEEGKFYLWSEEEIRQVLEKEEAEYIIKAFNVEREGNFTEELAWGSAGRNIFHLKKSLSEMASELNIPWERFLLALEVALQKLFVKRKTRIPPYKDDKILTDWNGLMIAALAKGARVFDEPKYTQAASRAAGFILRNMRSKEGRLYHRYRAGEVAIPAFLDDYAFFIWGLIELYETTFEVPYLQTALNLTNDLFNHFWDDRNGGFFFTGDDNEDLLIRKKEIYDGAVPSGNSVAMLNLLRLARMTANHDWEKKAAQIGRAFYHDVSRSPAAYTQLMLAVDFGIGPTFELVIAGKLEEDNTKAMLRTLRRQFIPKKIVLFRPSGLDSSDITHLAAFTKNQVSINGKATAYVCEDYNCNFPTTDIEEMQKLLDRKTS